MKKDVFDGIIASSEKLLEKIGTCHNREEQTMLTITAMSGIIGMCVGAKNMEFESNEIEEEKKPGLLIDFSILRHNSGAKTDEMLFNQIKDEIKKLSEKYRYLKIYGEY